MFSHCFLCWICFLPVVESPSEPSPKELRDIELVASQGLGTDQGRAAWKRLAQGRAELLPTLLQVMNSDDIVRCNWIRTAFERILEREKKARPEAIDVDALFIFAIDKENQGRARRFALSVVEQFRPGTTKKLLPNWVDDPEFRFDAVDWWLAEAEDIAQEGHKKEAIFAFELAMEHTRDVQQAKKVASGLLDLGKEVSVARHFGFLMDWYVIGPFDAKGKKGFTTVYPPEKNVDLQGEYPGQSGKVKWKHYQVQESSPKVRSRHVALVNLRESKALGDADDAVAFAYTEIRVPEARKVEFRGAADDNFIVWVNGERVFGFEEYTNGVRHDRHRIASASKKLNL